MAFLRCTVSIIKRIHRANWLCRSSRDPWDDEIEGWIVSKRAALRMRYPKAEPEFSAQPIAGHIATTIISEEPIEWTLAQKLVVASTLSKCEDYLSVRKTPQASLRSIPASTRSCAWPWSRCLTLKQHSALNRLISQCVHDALMTSYDTHMQKLSISMRLLLLDSFRLRDTWIL